MIRRIFSLVHFKYIVASQKKYFLINSPGTKNLIWNYLNHHGRTFYVIFNISYKLYRSDFATALYNFQDHQLNKNTFFFLLIA